MAVLHSWKKVRMKIKILKPKRLLPPLWENRLLVQCAFLMGENVKVPRQKYFLFITGMIFSTWKQRGFLDPWAKWISFIKFFSIERYHLQACLYVKCMYVQGHTVKIFVEDKDTAIRNVKKNNQSCPSWGTSHILQIRVKIMRLNFINICWSDTKWWISV